MKKKRKRKLPQPGRKPGRPFGTAIPPEQVKTRKSIRYNVAEWGEIVTAADADGVLAAVLVRNASLRAARRINRQRLDSHGG